MKPITQEWIEKAEGDLNAAQSLYRVRKLTNYDMVCFCTQQCAEKYLKARLEEANLAFPNTHDLTVLLNLTLAMEPNWVAIRSHLAGLNGYSIAFR